jgi:eukaryotic-like serine/threonine-protein kinase
VLQIKVAIQLADCLRRMHAKKIIHRDISPGNVLLSDGDTFKLADFGIARMCADTLQLTNQTSVAGNVAYMAPEQGRAQGTQQTRHATTDRVDVWAFAATLLHASTGRLPYGTGAAPLWPECTAGTAASGHAPPGCHQGRAAPTWGHSLPKLGHHGSSLLCLVELFSIGM